MRRKTVFSLNTSKPFQPSSQGNESLFSPTREEGGNDGMNSFHLPSLTLLKTKTKPPFSTAANLEIKNSSTKNATLSSNKMP